MAGGRNKKSAIAICFDQIVGRKKSMNLIEKAIDAIQSALNLTEKEDSLDAIRNDVRRQFDAKFQPQSEIVRDDHAWIVEVFEDRAIANVGEKHFSIPFTRSEKGVVEFADRSEWKEVMRKQEWIETGKALHDPEEDKKRKIAQRIHNNSLHLGAQCKVQKDADGNFRWTMITSSSFEDQEGEIVSLQALKDDVFRTDKGDDPGPVRFWHIGTPDIATRSPGPGLDIGAVDFRATHGKVLIESGLFADKAIGEAFSKADGLAASIAFFHPIDEPDKDGVYHHIHSFERSILPEGKQANLLSTQPVIEKDKDMNEDKLKIFAGIVGEDKAKQVIGDADSKEASAEAAGIASKESALLDTDALTKALAESLPGIIKPIVVTEIKLAMDTYKAESDKSSDNQDATDKAVQEQAEQTKAIADITGKLDAVTEAVTIVAKEVKELMDGQPRGNGQGYRPTQDTATLINKEDVEKAGATGSPLGAFIDNMILNGDSK